MEITFSYPILIRLDYTKYIVIPRGYNLVCDLASIEVQVQTRAGNVVYYSCFYMVENIQFDVMTMGSAIRHIGHKHHLCSLVTNGAISLGQLKKLTRNAKFICTICGRSAVFDEYLCQPEPYDYVCGACGKPFTTQTELLEHPCLPLG
jgi:predicted RNA-binding Zn-ribbon protein involved in translation (DUF1610 family)